MADLGNWLVRAREARGLTLEDAERDTRISRRYLQALEEEKFDVIPAPVYARGFLRSYSQYLGLDPQEAMARYPRDDDAYAAPVAQTRTTLGRQQREQRPAVGAENRPTWRRPTPIRGTGTGVIPSSMSAGEREPTIGIDIGVPVPTRRLDRDQSAPARTAAVVVVAIAAVLFVILLAFLLSSLGGDGDGGGIDLPEDGASVTGDGDDGAEATVTTGTSAQPGIVPLVEGLTQDQAIAEVRAAGFEPEIRTSPNNAAAGTVLMQAPAGNLEAEPGSRVILLVSEGPQ